jgi:hypothetical protein
LNFGFFLLSSLPLVPRRALRKSLGELMGDPDSEKSKRVIRLKMQNIIVTDLQKAYDS